MYLFVFCLLSVIFDTTVPFLLFFNYRFPCCGFFLLIFFLLIFFLHKKIHVSYISHTVGAKYSGKNAMDLAFLRLKKDQHEQALSYTNDDWTYEEITRKTKFFQIFDLLDMFMNGEKKKKEEKKRIMRRIKNPFEPIYDRRGRRKVYCTKCKQGYWSRTHNKFGSCPECRGNEKDERRCGVVWLLCYFLFFFFLFFFLFPPLCIDIILFFFSLTLIL